jgi:hypothetical protein
MANDDHVAILKQGADAWNEWRRTLLQEQLSDGPRPGAQVTAAAEAAEIPERSLLAAADVLGVRCRQGQWWLPG